MSEWVNRFGKYASYFDEKTVRRIMDEAQKEKTHKRVLLVLWLGLRSGARINELLLLRTDEAWNGYVPVWDDRAGKVKHVYVCKEYSEFEWLRGQIEYCRSGGMLLELNAGSIDKWVRTICKRAGVELDKYDGYSAIVRPYEERCKAVWDERTESFSI